MSLRGALVGFGSVLVASSAVLVGQSTRPPQQAPVFRGGVELVEVDVVVVDKDGKPVHGLSKDEFVLRDRNRPQAVETFDEVRREGEPEDALPALPAATRRDVASNTTNRASRLVVLVLDDLHTWRGRSDTVKDIARKIVAELGPDSSMALLQTGGDHGVEVTDDRSRLLEGIDRFGGRRMVRRPNAECSPQISHRDPMSDAPVEIGCDIQDFNADIGFYRTLRDAARLLGAGDRRRKAFILVSENLAKSLDGLFQVNAPPMRDAPDGSAYVAGGGAEAMAAAPIVAMSRYDMELQNMMDAMRRGGVATYSIDPRGEISTEKLMEECHPGTGDIHDPCLGGVTEPADWSAWVRMAQHGLETLSEASGGFAVVNSDDFTGGIGRIVSDLDNYYLLGFRPADEKTKGYRRLEVTIPGRPDLTLRYRRGYQLDANVEPVRRAGDSLAALVSTPLPKGDLPMRLYAVPMPHSGKEARVAIAAELTVPRRDLEGDGRLLLDEIRFGFYAIDMKGGKVREQFGRGARIALVPSRGGPLPDEVTYEITTVLPLAPGRYQIRASAESAKLGKGGSVYLSIDVPDFEAMPIGLTDLVLGYADGPRVPVARVLAASPARAMARMPAPVETVLPFDPTLERLFARSDTLRLYFRVVQKQPTPSVATITALTADGRVAVTLERPIDAKSPMLDIKLPLAQLAPGAYRLRVTVAAGGARAEREIGIAIR